MIGRSAPAARTNLNVAITLLPSVRQEVHTDEDPQQNTYEEDTSERFEEGSQEARRELLWDCGLGNFVPVSPP